MSEEFIMRVRLAAIKALRINWDERRPFSYILTKRAQFVKGE